MDVHQRKLRKTFGVTQSTIYSNLKKVSLKYDKRQKKLKYNKNQLEQVAKKSRKLRCQIAKSNTFLIVDNEKYFTFSNDEMSQNVDLDTIDKQHV